MRELVQARNTAEEVADAGKGVVVIPAGEAVEVPFSNSWTSWHFGAHCRPGHFACRMKVCGLAPRCHALLDFDQAW